MSKRVRGQNRILQDRRFPYVRAIPVGFRVNSQSPRVSMGLKQEQMLKGQSAALAEAADGIEKTHHSSRL